MPRILAPRVPPAFEPCQSGRPILKPTDANKRNDKSFRGLLLIATLNGFICGFLGILPGMIGGPAGAVLSTDYLGATVGAIFGLIWGGSLGNSVGLFRSHDRKSWEPSGWMLC